MIIELRNKIKDDLISGFKEAGIRPYITVTSFPDSPEALESIGKEAQAKPDGAIYIAWSAEEPGPKSGGIYGKLIDLFTIFIFSKSQEGDDEIIQHYELARNILNKSFYLYRGEMSPVKTAKTGLYIAYLQVGIQNIYQGH
ncbi:MAG: hypothetical protein M9949_14165 [Candidatus Kapabacteria bacterium]|nr:hypothetical protein [Candidatus Kapabacteria bacterium]